MKYYVYQLIDPRSNTVFYVGKGTGDRAYKHNQFKDGNNNFYKDSIIKQLHQQGLEPTVEIVEHFASEKDAYDYEDKLIETIGIDNLTNITEGSRPPSKKGWTPSADTLAKRSASLKGIKRTEEWCRKLSQSKQGANNPMYGEKSPCSEQKRLDIIRTKNQEHLETYKKAVAMMNSGFSTVQTWKTLSISRTTVIRLKNRTHGFFLLFPELK